MLLTLCTNFQVFAHFALQSSPMKLYFWYLSWKHFPETTHQYILFAPLFLHFKHFETSALLFVVERMLLDIGLNLRYSLVLSQTGNFPYSLKKSVSCMKLFSLKNFTLSLNEAPKARFFVFCYSFKVLLFSKNQIKLLCQTTKLFHCKTRVVRTIAVFIASQYIF